MGPAHKEEVYTASTHLHNGVSSNQMPFPLNFSGEKFSSQTGRLYCVLSYSTEINTIDIDVCNDHTDV